MDNINWNAATNVMEMDNELIVCNTLGSALNLVIFGNCTHWNKHLTFDSPVNADVLLSRTFSAANVRSHKVNVRDCAAAQNLYHKEKIKDNRNGLKKDTWNNASCQQWDLFVSLSDKLKIVHENMIIGCLLLYTTAVTQGGRASLKKQYIVNTHTQQSSSYRLVNVNKWSSRLYEIIQQTDPLNRSGTEEAASAHFFLWRVITETVQLLFLFWVQ